MNQNEMKQAAAEAALVNGVTILPAASLLAVVAHLCGHTVIEPYAGAPLVQAPDYPDLADVKGQSQARRALEVAASGQQRRRRHKHKRQHHVRNYTHIQKMCLARQPPQSSPKPPLRPHQPQAQAQAQAQMWQSLARQ